MVEMKEPWQISTAADGMESEFNNALIVSELQAMPLSIYSSSLHPATVPPPPTARPLV